MNNELLSLPNEDLRAKLLQSHNPDEIDDITKLFNLNLRKMELVRSDIYSELQNKIVSQVGKRIENNADSFSNKDLLDYMNSIQNIINKQDKEENKKIPTIAIQNNLTVNQSETLSKDSRDKIRDVIDSILKANENIITMEENNNEVN